MSSQEEDYNDSESQAQHSKKRRIQRACDICRRKKVRCDGGQMPGNRCSNCITYNYECTYVEAAKKRGPPKGYVESLEFRLEKMEKLLNRLCPDADFSQELGRKIDKEAFAAERSDADRGSMYKAQMSPNVGSPNSNMGTMGAPIDADDLDPSDDEITAQHTLAQHLKRIKLNPGHVRFFGKSSSVMFIQTAIDLKHEYAGTDPPRLDESHGAVLPHRRPQFWTTHPWVIPTIEDKKPHQNFPEDDLMVSLIDLYFERSNYYLPILHRPTFEHGIREGLHYRDEGFGSTILLVCAIGARFSDDRRVLLEGHDDTHSCGWQWFQQVQMVRRSLLAPPRLYDLQIYCLTALFLQGSSAPQACWTVIGVGIRLAQDVGAHRRKVYNPAPTVEEELWKRAFWVLVAMDRSTSAGLGRPCAIQDEDFDLDLPVECDDEYWTNPDPTLAFKQPPDKPSKVTFFNCYLRLNQILSFALRTIYSINKSKALLGFVGPQWEQHIVAELDSALNKWIDSVPDHLRWDPNREDIIFLNQSAHLYASYYQLQIAVHRPFIPSPRKPSPLSFPSLAICTNAARSCTHVLDVQFKRTGAPRNQNQMALFTSGIVLLLNIWGGKRSGAATDAGKEMADVHKCMKMLKALEPRWHTAGRLWDVLYELASVGDLPLPQSSPAPSHKRDRDSDSPIASSAGSQTPTGQTPTDGRRTIAGSKRVSRDVSTAATSSFSAQKSQSPPPHIQPRTAPAPTPISSFALPLHSDELGRLPLHPTFNVASHHEDWYPSMNIPDHAVPMHVNAQPEAGPSSGVAGMHNLNSSAVDAYMTSIFDMQPSSVYDQMLSSLGTPLPHPGQLPRSPDPQEYTQHMQSMSNGMPSGGIGNPISPMNGPPDAAFDNDTLAMWSVAPTGFEWDDWNAYIANVGGMSNVADTTQHLGNNRQI